MLEGGGRSNSGASCRTEGIQPIHTSAVDGASASSAHAFVKATVAAVGWLWRTET